MIRASHIVQLLTYAAQECYEMAECHGANELSQSRLDVLAQLDRIKMAVKRADERSQTEAANRIIEAASEQWLVRPRDITQGETGGDVSRARRACAHALLSTYPGAVSAVTSRLGVSADAVRKARSEADRILRIDSDFRARYERMLELLSSGDGHTGEITQTTGQ